jgi:hypothetical protein
MSILLLIDSLVVDYQSIQAAARDNVRTLIFNQYEDTYASLTEKIAALGLSTIETIGIVQHGSDRASQYMLLQKEAPMNVKSDPELTSWSDIILFYNNLRSIYGITTIDLISCLLYRSPEWVSIIRALEEKTGINFRASSNETGNLKSGGDWIQESDGVDIRDIYFTDAIHAYRDLLFMSYGRGFKQISEATTRTNVTARMVSATNKVLDMVNISDNTNGIETNIYGWGGLYSILPLSTSPLSTTIKSYTYKSNAFALIDGTNNVVAVGDPGDGGTVPSSLSTGDIIQIASHNLALIALKSTGEVVQWGVSPIYGFTATPPEGLTNVIAIAVTEYGVAALKSDGTVVAWGDSIDGGVVPVGLTDVSSIASSRYNFAALTSNGTVVSWGLNSPSDYGIGPASLTNVVSIISNRNAFAVLKADGTVICWGGDGGTAPLGLTNVVSIASTNFSFAALKDDHSVVAWGFESYIDHPIGLTNVVSITSTIDAFAALKTDGTVVSWGRRSYNMSAPTDLLGVIAICSTQGAFAALKTDGTVRCWGLTNYGGFTPPYLTGVVSITSNAYAFTALKNDGTFQCWGNASYGGTAPTYGPNTYAAILPLGYGDFIGLTSYKEVPITVHPLSYNVQPGSSYTMYVRGYNSYFNGKPINYKWYKNGVEIVGATSNSYTISNMSSSDVGSYTSHLTSYRSNDTTITSDMSEPAIITMYTPPSLIPSITSHPISQTVFDGSSATFSVVATGTATLNYQWYKGESPIADESSSTFTISAVSSSDTGSYKVVVSNGQGSATSNVATLTVQPAPVAPSIMTHPVSQTVFDGSSATFSVVATGTATLNYQWYKGESPIADESSSTFTISAVSSSDAGSYKVVVSNGQGSATSNVATLMVVIPLTFTRQIDASPNAIVGARVFFRVAVSGSGPITYAWYKNGTPIENASAAIYDISDVQVLDAGSYTVVASSPYSSISSTGTLTVTPVSITGNTTTSLSTVMNGNIPLNTRVQFPGKNINNTNSTYVGASIPIQNSSTAFIANPTATAASQQSVSLTGMPATVQRAVIAMTPSIVQSGTPNRTVNVQIKLFDADNNYVSDVSNSPVTVRIKMPSTITANTLSVYRVLNAETGTLEVAGTATKLDATAQTPATTYELVLNRFSEFIFSEEPLIVEPYVPCFPAGTRVLTTEGFKAVERLNKADRLLTSDGRVVEFKRYYSVITRATKETAPYRIPAETFGPRQPSADITLSPLHAFQLRKNVWQIPRNVAKTYSQIEQYDIGKSVIYFHLQMPHYLRDNIVLEGGIVAESYGGPEFANQSDIYIYNVSLNGFTRRPYSVNKNSVHL